MTFSLLSGQLAEKSGVCNYRGMQFDGYSAVFIDIDNTLLDFDAYVRGTLEEGFTRFGIVKYRDWMYDLFEKVNDSLWRRLERKEIDFEKLKQIRFDTYFKELGVNFDGPVFEQYFRDKLSESAIPIDGAKQLLEKLHGKVVLCAASNGPYKQQVTRLKLAGFDKYFEYFFISEKVGYSKPSKEFFDVAFAELNEGRTIKIKPQQCLIIGDSMTSDIAGGHEYGLATCLYLHRGAADPDSRVDFTVRSLTELL